MTVVVSKTGCVHRAFHSVGTSLTPSGFGFLYSMRGAGAKILSATERRRWFEPLLRRLAGPTEPPAAAAHLLLGLHAAAAV